MTNRFEAWLLLAATFLLTGCMGGSSYGETATGPWTERMELGVGERGSFAEGALAVIPTEIGDQHALVTIEGPGGSSGGRLTTDPGGFVTIPPYRIYLLSAEEDERAVIAVGPSGDGGSRGGTERD